MIRILDTFLAFLSYWEKYANTPVPKQIDGWVKEYMNQWPELLLKQRKDYADLGEDWEHIAREKVFPFLPDRIELMKEAHANLTANLVSIHEKAQHEFELPELDILYTIYVGLGNGAGWLTSLKGTQAILFGLEMIAECGWTDPGLIRGLIAHEVGHATHGILRGDPELNQQKGPWWQLYTEGFAQHCEHILMGRNSWHEGKGLNDESWLEWCTNNRGMLAARFIKDVDNEEDIRPFFGSWYDIQGYRQCGYYLGHEVVLNLEHRMDITEIATFRDIEAEMRIGLESFVHESL
jgi:hypothetical protein